MPGRSPAHQWARSEEAPWTSRHSRGQERNVVPSVPELTVTIRPGVDPSRSTPPVPSRWRARMSRLRVMGIRPRSARPEKGAVSKPAAAKRSR